MYYPQMGAGQGGVGMRHNRHRVTGSLGSETPGEGVDGGGPEAQEERFSRRWMVPGLLRAPMC